MVAVIANCACARTPSLTWFPGETSVGFLLVPGFPHPISRRQQAGLCLSFLSTFHYLCISSPSSDRCEPSSFSATGPSGRSGPDWKLSSFLSLPVSHRSVTQAHTSVRMASFISLPDNFTKLCPSSPVAFLSTAVPAWSAALCRSCPCPRGSVHLPVCTCLPSTWARPSLMPVGQPDPAHP